MSFNEFQNFLNELAEALQFSSLKPDEWGGCMIAFKESHAALLFEFDEQLVPNTVLVSSPICTLPLENRSEIFEACLKANASNEATLSCKPDEDILYLHRRLHPEIRAQELQAALTEFLAQQVKWIQEVEKISKEPPKYFHFPFPPEHLQFPPFKR